MTNENITCPVQEAGEPPRRHFTVYDSMTLVGGVALFLGFSSSRSLLFLYEQGCGLLWTFAVYYNFTANPFRVPRFLMEEMANRASAVRWYAAQASEVLLLSLTPVFLLMRL